MTDTEKAHALYKGGQYLGAIELYEKALNSTTSPAHVAALQSNRAACYLRLKNFTKAAEACTAVLAVAPTNANVLLLRAQARQTLKDYVGAQADVERLLELKPGDAHYLLMQKRLMSLMTADVQNDATTDTSITSPRSSSGSTHPAFPNGSSTPDGYHSAASSPRSHSLSHTSSPRAEYGRKQASFFSTEVEEELAGLRHSAQREPSWSSASSGMESRNTSARNPLVKPPPPSFPNKKQKAFRLPTRPMALGPGEVPPLPASTMADKSLANKLGGLNISTGTVKDSRSCNPPPAPHKKTDYSQWKDVDLSDDEEEEAEPKVEPQYVYKIKGIKIEGVKEVK